MRIQFLRQGALLSVLLFGGMAMADSLAERDQEFLEQAAQNGHAEMSASRLALAKARNQKVREFALRMIDDHQRMDAELTSLAASKKYTPPKEPSMLQKGKEMLIANLGNDSFDQRYMNQMGVQAHEETLRLFEEASRDARDPDVKAFASKHLQGLREHLKAARSLHANLMPGSTGSKR